MGTLDAVLEQKQEQQRREICLNCFLWEHQKKSSFAGYICCLLPGFAWVADVNEDKDFIQLVLYWWISQSCADYSRNAFLFQTLLQLLIWIEYGDILFYVELSWHHQESTATFVTMLLWLNDLSGGFFLCAVSSSPYAKGHGDIDVVTVMDFPKKW